MNTSTFKTISQQNNGGFAQVISEIEDIDETNVDTIQLEIHSKLGDFLKNNPRPSFNDSIQFLMSIFEHVDKFLPIIVQAHEESWLEILKTTLEKIDINKKSIIDNRSYVANRTNIIMRMEGFHDRLVNAIENW